VVTGCLLIPLARPASAITTVFSAVAIQAFGTRLVNPSLRSLVSRRLEGSGQGAALGSLQGLQSAGSFIGPPLAGLAYETLGHQSPFWLSIALMVAVAVLVAGGTRRQAVPTPESSARDC
jgi:MFS family permease